MIVHCAFVHIAFGKTCTIRINMRNAQCVMCSLCCVCVGNVALLVVVCVGHVALLVTFTVQRATYKQTKHGTRQRTHTHTHTPPSDSDLTLLVVVVLVLILALMLVLILVLARMLLPVLLSIAEKPPFDQLEQLQTAVWGWLVLVLVLMLLLLFFVFLVFALLLTSHCLSPM